MILAVVVVVAVGIFALNYFNVIHLWGKKTVKIAERLPEPLPEPEAQTPESQNQAATQPGTEPETTPTLTPVPEAARPSTPAATTHTPEAAPTLRPVTEKPHLPPSGTGKYTVQVSSWTNRGVADKEVARLTAAGYDAYVVEGDVSGQTWYRVRVGHYGTSGDAKEAASQLQKISEGTVWVAMAK
jgi:cell division protein FtsN